MGNKPFFRPTFRAADASSSRALGTVVLVALVSSLIASAAWVTHVVACIRAAEWGFLIAGAIAFPIGVVHGIGIWFGIW